MRAFLSVGVMAALLCFWAAAQQPKETPSWAPKYEPAKYPPGHKPHTKLADLKAKHKGQANWQEVIVNDEHLHSEYIQSAPGTKVSRRYHPDTREWWVVMDGQIRFDIEGQDSFVARRAQWCRFRRKPRIRWRPSAISPRCDSKQTSQKRRLSIRRTSNRPTLPGATWIPVVFNRKPFPYGLRQQAAYQSLRAARKDPAYKGSRFVHDDRAVSNIIYGYAKKLPPLNEKDRGHYHPECAEFWLIMQGQIRYPIENVGVIIASEGDVVYVPPFTFHAPRFWGDGPSTRLAMNGYPNIAHLRDAVQPH